MFPPFLRAHLVLLIVYVAVISAAGVSVNHSSALPPAANLDDPGDFTVPAPGGSIAHDLPSIGPSNPFTHVGADDNPKDLHTTVEGIANVKLSRDLVVSRHVHDKRIRWRPEWSSSSSSPRFKDCSDQDEEDLKSAADYALELLNDAISSLRAPRSASSQANFALWFGEYSEGRGHTVRNNLGRMKGHLPFVRFTFRCDCGGDIPAEILIRRRIIKICDPFWGGTQHDQAGIFLSFAARLVPLDMYTTGLMATRLLVLRAPMEASTNEDSYVAYILKEGDPLRQTLPPNSVYSPANNYPPPPPLYEHPPSYGLPPYNGRLEGS